jgi:hypothetical protein
MTSSLTQLVLDLIVFAVFHYYIIFPLITYILGSITGEQTTDDSTTVYETLKDFISENKKRPTTAPFTTQGSSTDDIECEKCGLLLEDQACITRTNCNCTWCAECVEECFEAVKFDLDSPLKGLSRSCEAARNVTMREMAPFVREALSEQTIRYVDTIGPIEMEKDDWMFDVDEEEK